MNAPLSDKLLNFQVEPPAQLWGKIADALDAEASTNFTERLYTYEVQPPAATWQIISTALDEPVAPVVPLFRKFAKPFRYAGIAATVLIVALLLNLLFSKKTISETVATVNPATIKSSASGPSKPEQQQYAEKAVEKKEPDFFSTKPLKRSFIKAHPIALNASSLRHDRIASTVFNTQPIVQSNIADRYILLSKATGEAVRLSKKLFSLFACSDNNDACKEHIETMQQQISSPTLMASADFSGVLDLLQTMPNQ